MASKDKESKTLEKLKQFFRGTKTVPVAGNYKTKSEFILKTEIEKEIGPETPVAQRIKTIKELSEIVVSNRLEEYGVERLWSLVKDLLQKDVEKEHRHVAIEFLKCLAQGQYERMGPMRVCFFQLVRKHDIAEDTALLLELLCVLTNDGRDIHSLEDEFGGFVSNWFQAVAGAGRMAPFLDLIINFLKCNAAYVERLDIINIVNFSCYICCWSTDEDVVEKCLKVLETVFTYSELPHEGLRDITAALCRKVNTNTPKCWQIMRQLLGTHLGHSALFTLCKFLQDPGSHSDAMLLRGAVFFIYMGLWSDKRVPSLKCTATSVLPSLIQALECKHTIVIYEVMNGVNLLVATNGLILHEPAWDVVIDILKGVANYCENLENHQTSDALLIANKLHDTISKIEQFVELGQFNGSVPNVFDLIQSNSKNRPESSVLRLIAYLSGFIRPTRLEWLTKLDGLVDRYFKQEPRPNIRIKVVEVVSSVVAKYRYIYEEELIERIILVYFSHVDQEAELCVRNAAAQLLLAVCLESESKKCVDVLNILEKLLNRPYDQNIGHFSSENDILDVKTVAAGLVQIFHAKIHQTPPCHAIRTYKILISHLENHYQHLNYLDFLHSVHITIFDMILKLRVNRLGHVGLVELSGPRFSPYLTVEMNTGFQGSGGSAPPSPAPTPFSLTSASKVIVSALRLEKDYRIINLLLQELPTVLQNKALVAEKEGADVGYLADALCSMVSDKTLNLPDSLKYGPPKLNRTEFQSNVFPVIAAISAYHNYLEPSQKVRCIKCLEFGLASKCAAQCVLAITTCALEMRDAMYKLLPEVLLNLSKISATVYIAIPILEFLSTLTSLPKVFASFVGDQYMSVFAIALPYTNPFKYNHYTVSLAHHVIAVWFLKCRLPFRRDFVKFITMGLKANAIVPFEETQLLKSSDLAALNEDSTSRKRSSSLTEPGSRRRPLSNTRLAADLRPRIDESLMNFHIELTETCIDLMARYTFSSCEARATRSTTADFLLNGGQSQTWLLGHKLITVTTSGCSQKPLKNNLCDHCWMVCRLDRDLLSPELEKNSEDVLGEKDLVKRSGDTELQKFIFGSLVEDPKAGKDVCMCWCQGWAEIQIRRPTGEMSWIMRLENNTASSSSAFDSSDLSALFLRGQQKRSTVSSVEESCETSITDNTGILTISTHLQQPTANMPASQPVVIPNSPGSRQTSRESITMEEGSEDGDETYDVDPVNIRYPKISQPTPIIGGKSRNPVRRSNSSPEMSASWKNPFLKEKGQNEDSPKARVSCEAIPEEMTPPDPPVPIPPPELRLDVGLSVDVAVRPVRGPATTGEIESSTDEHTALRADAFTRDRSQTISVMSPARKSRYELDLTKPKPHSPRNKDTPRSGVSPSFVFLQLYHSAQFGDEKPILISNDPVLQRAISILDLIPPFETHKVGVVYVGPGQAGNESEMLKNEFGSLRYAKFLQSLGTLINLKNADPKAIFLGGLDKNGADGKFAYIWQDDVTQVTFHVATLMPNKESDPNCTAKILHIGNDYVTIVYNESGEEYNLVKFGQFNYASIVIQPMDMGSNKVTVKAKEELADHIGHSEQKIVSDENLPILARQLALHVNLASEVCRSLKTKTRDPYASNWLERLRKIKRLRKKLMEREEHTEAQPLRKRPDPVDFTDYT